MLQEIKLSIFEPLNEYFQILCVKCNYKKEYISNKNLINLLTNKCDKDNNSGNEISNEVSKNFLNALEQFAINLKEVDKPIGYITIKNSLHQIFMNTDFNKNTLDILSDINQKVINDENCRTVKFNINDEIYIEGNKYTYYSVLYNIINKFKNENKNIIQNEIFNKWLLESFDLYQDSIKYFKENFLNEILKKPMDSYEII